MKEANTSKWMLLGDQAVVSGGTFVSQLMIAACIGVAQYGRFSVLVLTQLFLLSLQQAGISGIFQAFYPGLRPELKNDYLQGIWTLQFLFFGAIIATMSVIYPIHNFNLSILEWNVCILNIVLFLMQDFLRRLFITQKHIGSLLFIDIINNLLQVAGIAALYLLHLQKLAYVLWICGLSFIPGLIWASLKYAPALHLKKLRYVFHFHKAEAGWMTASALLQWFAGNFYVIAAGWWLGETTLGILRLGQYGFGILNVILQAAESYLLPRAGSRADSPADAIRYLKTAQFKILSGVALFLTILVAAAQITITYLKPPDTEQLIIVLYGLSAVYVFIAIGYPIRIALRTLRLGKIFFKGYILTALFGFSTAYIFIHYWNITGVMIGLLTSQILMIGYWFSTLQRKYQLSWK